MLPGAFNGDDHPLGRLRFDGSLTGASPRVALGLQAIPGWSIIPLRMSESLNFPAEAA